MEIPFGYSAEFAVLIRESHSAARELNTYERHIALHLGGEGSRLADVLARTIPEIEHYTGPLGGQRVLDFGCGTGATTAALRSRGAQVTGFDIDEPSITINRRRLEEHGYVDVELLVGQYLDRFPLEQGGFDLVLMNAVIEHVPKSIRGERRRILNDAFSMLRPGGILFINQSPNRLWPKDIYATGLWFASWSKPGSDRVYRRAVRRGRQHPTSEMGRKLEDRGVWGITYWEVMRHLPKSAICLNSVPPNDRHVAQTGPAPSGLRRLAERTAHNLLTRTVGAPIVAAMPMCSPLVILNGDRTGPGGQPADRGW